MYIKLVGIMFILSGCAIYGLFLCYRTNRRIDELAEYKETLILLEGQISYGNYCLPLICTKLSNVCKIAHIRSFYKNVGERLNENAGLEFSVIWSECINEFLKNSYLYDSDKALLAGIGNIPLYLDGSAQINYLEEIKLRLEGLTNCARAEADSKCRVYKYVGLAAGAFIIILLI